MEDRNLTYFLLDGLKNQALTKTAARSLNKLTINSKEYFKENINETTQRLIQNTRTISTKLLENDAITDREFIIIRTISKELVYCNNLWRCKLNLTNKTTKQAIDGLVAKHIIFKTECKGLYLVNPYCIRYGEFFEVLFSTLNIIDTQELNLGMAIIVKPFKGQGLELINN